MTDWQKMNDYYLQNGAWTICKLLSAKLPYELWNGSKRVGMFRTSNEAKAEHAKLTGWPQSKNHPANRGEE